MKHCYDAIVVGSGPSGAMAAQDLVAANLDVAMIDVGMADDYYHSLIPDKDFVSIRETETDQPAYFLGKDFSGIPMADIQGGPQLTPPRRFVVEGVEKWLPTVSDNFRPVESLAYGGLGEGWGLASFVFSKAEITAIGLDYDPLLSAYRHIVDQIGVSGARDDGAPFCLGELNNIQGPLCMEAGMSGIYARYQKIKKSLNKQNIFVGRTPLALLSADLGGRRATAYNDMDFWANTNQSAYRPSITINNLKKVSNFVYIGKYLVTKFFDTGDAVEVIARHITTRQEEKFFCKRLVLAAGTLGTARIAMRSLANAPERLPLLCGAYYYFACLQPRMFGQEVDIKKVSYSQLSLFYDEEKNGLDVVTAMLYTYSSLQLFRLAYELPFAFADTLRLLKLGYPSLLIAGVHHPDSPTPEKYVKLIKDPSSLTGDKLLIQYKLADSEIERNTGREKIIKKALRHLGCWPVKRVDPGYGSSIHYGGTLPFDDSGRPFTLAKSGRLSGTKRVYVADGSGFRHMPAKGPTLTFMANAHIVANNVLKSFGHE